MYKNKRNCYRITPSINIYIIKFSTIIVKIIVLGLTDLKQDYLVERKIYIYLLT